MYAIANVVYGVSAESIHHKVSEIIKEDEELQELCDLNDPETWGFETAYSGSADHIPGWVGIKIWDFDECNNFYIQDLINATSEESLEKLKIKEKYKALLNNIPEKIRAILPEPKVQVIWSTS